VDDAVAAGIDFGVCGGDWDKIIDPSHVLCEFIPNHDLRLYYSSAKVVLNDHWPDMQRHGFISNRLFDAGACAAAIISDDVSELASVFGDSIRTYRSPADLKRQVEELASRPSLRRKLGERLRQTILANHTFDHRADLIWKYVNEELRQTIAKPHT
jgi:spore maturation protein CgeB